MDCEIKSPDYLGHKPNKHDDVVRIGRRPLIYTGITMIAVVGVTTYTLAIKSLAGSCAQEGSQKNDLLTNIPLLEKKPSMGILGINNTPAKKQTTAPDTGLMVPPPPVATNVPAPNPYQDAQFQMWQQQEQAKLQLEQAKQTALHNALTADTSVYTNNQTCEKTHSPLLFGSVKKQIDYSHPQLASLDIPREPPDTGEYLMHTRIQPVSPFELKAGTIVPSVLIGGINSDLPGQIIAQVSQSVYDTATGQHLLIPQGSKLVGIYDHQVAQGQNRVLIVWHRLIYPDASSVNLGDMNGVDRSGYAGFGDKTNTHFWPTFRNAIMLSAITAGVQLSQPKATQNGTYSSQQMIAGSLGMQMNNFGMLSMAHKMNQAPTISIRPGYIFNVFLNKDVILPPWQGNDGGATTDGA